MADNDYVNKIIYGNNTLIDLTEDTVTASDVAAGKSFHLASGRSAVGEAVGKGIEYIVGTQTGATNAWTGVTEDASLYVGKTIAYYLPYAGTDSAATLTLTLSGGTTTNAISLRRQATSTVTTHFAANNVIILTYDGTYWRVNAYYDSNTNTIAYYIRTRYFTAPLKTQLGRYRLVFTSMGGEYLIPANKTTSTGVDAAKAATDEPFDPFGEINYYTATTIVAANEFPAEDRLYTQYVFYIGYSFSNGSAATLTIDAPVYLKCTPQSDGSAVLNSSTPYVQTLPTTADGSIYIYLGTAYSATQVEMHYNHPIYYHDGTVIRQWTGVDSPSRADVSSMITTALSAYENGNTSSY